MGEVVRLGFVADVHIGNHGSGAVVSGLNRRCTEHVEVLRNAVYMAAQKKLDALVVLGDLFDSSSPSPQIVAAVQRTLDSSVLPVVVLKGNHDAVSEAEGDHALGPLEPVVDVIAKPTVLEIGGGSLICIPHQPGCADEWFPRVLGDLVGNAKLLGVRALAFHLGVRDGSTAPWLKESHDSIDVEYLRELCREHSIGAAFAGNWHDRRLWTLAADYPKHVCQVGALIPTGWDNPGFDGYGGLVIGSSKGMSIGVEEICPVPGPRFLKLRFREDAEQIGAAFERAEKEGHKLYLRLTVRVQDAEDARRAIVHAIGEKYIADGSVEIDDTEAVAAARTAATVARSAKTLEEAIAAFVEQIDLPVGVVREDVLARTNRYLGA